MPPTTLSLPLRPAQPPLAKHALPRPGFRLFEALPLETVEQILGYLELAELLRLKQLSTSWRALVSQPHLYNTISFSFGPSFRLPATLKSLAALLPGTKHLALRSFPSSALQLLLLAVEPSALVSLDLSFSGVTDSDLAVLFLRDKAGLPRLKTLRLKGCRRLTTLSSAFAPDTSANDSAATSATSTRFPSLHTLDLSWSSLSLLFPTIPPPAPHPSTSLFNAFPALTSLSLSSCPYLPPDLPLALEALPAGVVDLDLSHLGLGEADLRGLGFLSGGEDGREDVCATRGNSSTAPHRTEGGDAQEGLSRSAGPLRLNLAGNDALTLRSLAVLQRHWGASAALAGRKVDVEHSGVLLESDDEEDVRRFVEMVAGVAARG
ncbi:hypothetical protein JCM10207_002417 [Rhodosporidiobolus poonsookiae]